MKKLSILLCLIIPFFAFNQNPYDECDNALSINLTPPFNCSLSGFNQISLDNVDATNSSSGPIFVDCNFNSPVADVWLRFTAVTELLDIELIGDLNQPQLGLYLDSGCDNLIEVNCASANTPNNNIEATFQVNQGQAYFLLISGGNLSDQGVFTINFTNYNQSTPPTNDDCNNSELLAIPPLPQPCPSNDPSSISLCGNILNASFDAPDNYSMDQCNGSDLSFTGNNIWYNFTSVSNRLNLTLNHNWSKANAVLFKDGNCIDMPLVDCTEEEGDINYTFNVTEGEDYKLAIAAPEGITDGGFDLLLEAFNSCVSISPDECVNADTLLLSTPAPCPSTVAAINVFTGSNIGATPTVPYPLFSGCNPGGSLDGPAAEVWYRFIATTNTTQITLSSTELEGLNLAVFIGNTCSILTPIACASGDGDNLLLEFNSLVGTTYHLLVSGKDIGDQGNFTLTFESFNDCFPCLLGDYLEVSPPPVNGTYAAGTTVNFCYTINQWDVTSSVEWLHSVTLDIGTGWDYSSLTPTLVPPSCGGDGQWLFIENNWVGCNTGDIFGPGFAYDSASGIGCGGAPNDGDPGNNWGDGTSGCSNINPGNPVEFCWSLVVDDCAPNTNGADLSVNVSVWSDGDSGSWTNVGCNSGAQTTFLASAVCCTDSIPAVAIFEYPTCFQPTGVIYAQGGSLGDLYNIYLFNDFGDLIDQQLGTQDGVLFSNLLAGGYSLLFENITTGCVVNTSIFLPDIFFIDVFAYQNFDCDGVIQLVAEAFPFGDEYSYTWFGPGGFIDFGPIVIVPEPGLYTLEVQSDEGCVTNYTIFAEDETPLDISIDGDTTGCIGSEITLFVEDIVGGPYLYNWSDGQVTPIINVLLTDTLEISVTVTNFDGCDGIATTTIFPQLAEAPEYIITPLDSINPPGGFCESNTYKIEVPDDYFAIVFNSNGDFVSDFAFFEYTIPDSLSQDTLFIDYQGPAPYFCFGLDTLVLEPYVPQLFDQDSLELCLGSATLSINNPTPNDTILWSTGDTTTSIDIIVDQMATYNVTVTRGCTIVDSIKVIPLPDVVVDLDPDQIFCEPMSSSLSANASGGTPPFTYEWIASDGSQSNSATIDVSPIVGDNEYIVIVTDSLGCSEIDTTNILVAPISSPIIISNPTCEGEAVELFVTPTNFTEYLWSDGQNSPLISVIDAGTYCVTVTDTNGCFAESCIDVMFEPLPDPVDIFCNATLTSIDFNWVNDPNLNYQVAVLTGQTGILNGSTFTVDGLTFGQSVTIELSIINAFGCITTVTQTCTTQDCPNIDIQITPIPDICLTANATPITLEAVVTGSMGMGMSSWSGPGIIDATNGIFDPLSVGPGLHTVVFTYEEGGCIANAAINIQIDEPILPPIISCAATTTSIEFAWNDVPGAAAYSVNVLSGPSGIITSNSYVIEGLNPGEEICIEVIADPATSCDPVSAQLCCTAEACPSIQIDVQDTYDICEDEAPFQIPYTISGGNGTGTISWDGPCIDNNGVFDPSLCGPGVYTVVISYFEGPCEYQEPIVVFINQKPSASFTASASELCIGETVLVNYTGNASSSASFSWDFGGGNILVGQGFGPYEVQWNTAGTKTISLVVEENGCVSEVFTQQVEVIEAIEAPIISCVATTSSIEFVWNPVVGAIEYEVSIDGAVNTTTFTNITIDGLNPDQIVEIQVTAITDNICGNTTAVLTCITLPCPDITVSLDTPYPTVCLSDEDSPTDFLLSAVIVGGNGAGDELWEGPGIIDPLAGIFDPNEAGIGIHEITYTYTEDNCSYQESLTIEVTTELMFENINLVCSDDEETYSLTLDIITPDGIIPFQSEAVDNGVPLQVSIDNAPGCGSPFFYETTRECDCLTYAGTLDLAIDNLCGLPSIELTHNGDDFLVEDDILRFILHSNNGNVLGEIFAISETPNFSLEGDLEAGVTYYVSAVAGNTSSFETLNLDDPCLSVSPPQAIVFAEAIDLAVSQDTFICSGEIYQLVATFNNADSLAWSPVVGLSCVDCPNPIAAPDASTTYTITAYNDAGCTEQTNVTIYVDEIPNFLPNEPIAVCPGEYVDICLPDALAYEWNGPNGYFSIDQCLVWPDFDPIYGGNYTVEIQISENCTITDQLELFATPEQTINFLTPDFAACPNEVFTLSADIEEAVSYRWFPTENVEDNQSPTTNAFTTTPTAFTLQTIDQYGCEGLFVVFVTNETDCEIDSEIPLSDFTGGNNTQQLAQHKNNMATPIRIFPNPSTNVFNITSPSIIQTIEVFHINGQLIDQYQPNESNYRVDAQHWQAGTYLIRIKNQNGIHHQRVVKIQE